MKNRVTTKLLLALLLPLLPAMSSAQMEKSIMLNEVMTNNTASLQDEYGCCNAWVEIANRSYSTYNVRGMYITTDKSVLDPNMSVPERIKRMSVIPSGDPRTSLSAQQHLLLFCNSTPAKGALHLTVKINPEEPTWIALYNGNAVNLIDSITIPAIGANYSFARTNKGANTWQVKAPDCVTPGINNFIEASESKIDMLKREDPHGFGITVMAMGIVFSCLALLFVFFFFFGLFMRHRAAAKKITDIQPLKAGVRTVEMTREIGHRTNVILQDGLKSKGIDKEIYIAVIGMALKQYLDNVHDVESGVITIKPKDTDWNNELPQMTQFHE